MQRSISAARRRLLVPPLLLSWRRLLPPAAAAAIQLPLRLLRQVVDPLELPGPPATTIPNQPASQPVKIPA